jgi:cyclophilin family peptidyl-prolyl cis-trans isomerase
MRLAALAFAVLAALTPALAEDPAPPAPDATTPAPPETVVGPKVLIATSFGDITLRLNQSRAPLTVANFLRYAKEGHFDGTVVYRVVPAFVIQAGSWTADVKYRSVHDGVPLETGLPNKRGSIAMARGDATDSGTAEFFINLTDNGPLDANPAAPPNTTGYAVFGEVIAGMDVVDKISAVPRGDNGPMKGAAPVDPITIVKVEVVPEATP